MPHIFESNLSICKGQYPAAVEHYDKVKVHTSTNSLIRSTLCQNEVPDGNTLLEDM